MIEFQTFLPAETYELLGLRLSVHSNSREILDYLRQLFQAFFIGTCDELRHREDSRQVPPSVLTIIDHISRQRELIIEDDFSAYTLRCENLFALSSEDPHWREESPSPLAYVQWALLNNVVQRAKAYHLIHAAAVSWKEQAVIFPANPDQGKSTLCLGLLKRGFGFLSDEIACLHRDSARVSPFPRTVRIDEHSRGLLALTPSPGMTKYRPHSEHALWLLDIKSLMGPVGRKPARLRHIVFLQGLGQATRIEPVSTTSALLTLFKHTLRKPRKAAATLFEFAPLLDGVGCYNMVIGDLDDAVETVCDLTANGDRDTKV